MIRKAVMEHAGNMFGNRAACCTSPPRIESAPNSPKINWS